MTQLTGRAEVSATNPRAHGICDRCGARYNLHQLRWQHDWRGPNLQNLRILVCASCTDAFQPNGQKTFILPDDPVPVQYARPENYVVDSNALSAIGQAADTPFQSRAIYGSRIGTMINGGGINAAFDGNAYKPAHQCAQIAVNVSSYYNYVGINWQSNANAINAPSSLKTPVITHTLSSYTAIAPINAAFGSSLYVVQGSQVDVWSYGAWTTLASGTIAGTVGETISGTPSGGRYQFHRIAFLGSLTTTTPIYVAQVKFSVSDGSSW